MNKMKSEDGMYFERLGANFDEWMSDYDVMRRVELIIDLLPDDASAMDCLEIGCGTGRISEGLLCRVQSLTVADISFSLAKRTGERLDVPYISADACSLDIPDGQYDLVVSSECIEHTPDPLVALDEMHRILRPGGLLVVTTPNRIWFPFICLLSVLHIRKFNGPEFWVMPNTARRYLEHKKMCILAISGCHLFPWQLPFAKKILPYFDRLGHHLYPLMINFGIVARK